jgi:hypothetical protein
MGQYYLIANLDKKEYLHPHKFGEGLKLMEFGHSRSSILLALTVLLSDGNGRGGGDIHIPSYQKAIDKYTLQNDNFLKGKRKTKPKWPNPDKHNEPWVGRWAGDRIVITGDYADGGKFIEDVDDETKQKIANEHYTEKYRQKERVNLFAVADEMFTDISDNILGVLSAANELPSDVQSEIRSMRPDMVVSVKKD